MIQPKLKLQVDHQAESIWIVDETGVYTANNTGGYGAPNSDLNTVALVTVFQFISKGTIQYPAVKSSSSIIHNPGAANDVVHEFEYTYLNDGHYLTCLMVLPVSANDSDTLAGGTLADGDVYYNSVSEKVFRIVSSSPEEITDLSTLIDDETVPQGVCEDLFVVKLSIKQAQLYNKYVMNRDSGNVQQAKKYYTESSRLLSDLRGVDNNFWAGHVESAEKEIAKLLEIYEL